jgi:hypothetical protein
MSMTTMTGSVVRTMAAIGLAGSIAASPVAGQLAERVRSADDGTVRFEYPAHPDVEVCENGVRWGDDNMRWHWDGDREDSECVQGRAEVAMSVRNGRVRDVRVVRPDADLPSRFDRPVLDLGSVGAEDASDFLLGLVFEGATTDAAEEAILPAMLADGRDRWPELLEIARNDGIHQGVRKSALFWVGQAAADAVTDELADVATDGGEDQEIRNAAIFALSQRDESESVPALMEIARTGAESETRKTAMFWLAQSDDPRVVPFFEDVLLGRDLR